MESTRQAKISRLLQKELSEIFRLQTAKTHGTLVSVSIVRVSPDLSVAKVYLSIFPSERSQELLESIRDSAKTIRYELAQRVRFQLRKSPDQVRTGMNQQLIQRDCRDALRSFH